MQSALAASVAAKSVAQRPGHRVRRMQPWLGTYVEVTGWAATAAAAGLAVDRAFASIREAHVRWSFQDAASELSQLNRRPGERVFVTKATLRLLRLARALMRASDGSFDVTLGGQLVQDGCLPDHGGTRPLARGEAEDIVVTSQWALLARPVRLVLDGIAKGFAVDLAVCAMRQAGAWAGCINAGGDLRAFGGVTIPVQLRDSSGALRPAGGLRDMALATSCIDRARRDPTAFPARILGSLTGPAETGTWSVLAASAWRADALTKVAACSPYARRYDLLARLGGTLVERTP